MFSFLFDERPYLFSNKKQREKKDEKKLCHRSLIDDDVIDAIGSFDPIFLLLTGVWWPRKHRAVANTKELDITIGVHRQDRTVAKVDDGQSIASEAQDWVRRRGGVVDLRGGSGGDG